MRTIVILLMIGCYWTNAQSLAINEFMASNRTTLTDEDGIMRIG